MLSQTPEENADVFREFFEAQYKRKPTGRLSAADLLPQLPQCSRTQVACPHEERCAGPSRNST